MNMKVMRAEKTKRLVLNSPLTSQNAFSAQV